MAERRRVLGLAPGDHYAEVVMLGGFLGQKWADYSMYAEAVYSPDLHFEIARAVVWHAAAAGSLEYWARGPRWAIHSGGPGRPGPADLAILHRGLYLVGRVRPRAGRPPGLTNIPSVEAVREEVAAQIARGLRPTQASVAVAFLTGSRTLRKFLERHGTSWDEIRAT